jgi:magnesium-transporting ATPase (P-type)
MPILIAVLPGIIAIQSFGEVGALVSIAISGLATVWTLANKEKRYLIKYNLVVLAGLVSGFLVNYLSPGTLQRRAINEGSHSLSELYRNSIDPFQKMFSYTEWWHIALALFVALVIFYFLPKDGRKLPLKKATLQSLIVIASFLVVSAIAFGVSALSVGPYFVIRNYTVPGAWLFLSMAALLIIILRLLNPRSSNIIYGLFAISILLSVPYAIKKEAIYIRGMAIRDSFYSQRVISIQKQLSDNKKGRAIIVPPVKVLLYPTEAVDLEESDQPAIEWVVNMIGDHYKIPNYTSVNTPRYYCIPSGKYVRQDLTCEQSYHRASD